MDKKSMYKPQQRKSEETVLARENLRIEHKEFEIQLRENVRGKFIKVVESQGARRNSVIVPATGVEDFTRAIAKLYSKAA